MTVAELSRRVRERIGAQTFAVVCRVLHTAKRIEVRWELNSGWRSFSAPTVEGLWAQFDAAHQGTDENADADISSIDWALEGGIHG